MSADVGGYFRERYEAAIRAREALLEALAGNRDAPVLDRLNDFEEAVDSAARAEAYQQGFDSAVLDREARALNDDWATETTVYGPRTATGMTVAAHIRAGRISTVIGLADIRAIEDEARAAQRTEDAAIFDTALAEAAAESRAEYEAEPLDVARLHRAMLRHWSATMGNRLHVCVGGVGSCAEDIAAEYARLAEADR